MDVLRRYNVLKNSILAGCSESGMVSLWDCNTNKTVNEMKHHKAPCTGIAFSPINNKLLASVGLDKRCIFYDLDMKEKVSTIKLPNPITSIDCDGITVALGSSKGCVSIYDLRSCDVPVSQYQCPKTSPVSWLSYSSAVAAVPYSVAKSFSKSSKSVMSTSTTLDMTAQESKENAKMLDPIKVASPAINDDSLNGVFSPVNSKNLYCSDESQPNLSVSKDRPSSRFSVDSMFSPLREHSFNISNGGGSVGGSYCKTPLAGSGFNSPLASIREEIHPPLRVVQSEKGNNEVDVGTDVVDKRPASSFSLPPTPSKMTPVWIEQQKEPMHSKCQKEPDIRPKDLSPSKLHENSKLETKSSSDEEERISEVKAMLLAFPQMLNGSGKAEECIEEKPHSYLLKDACHNEKGDMGKDYLKSLQHEALDGFYKSIKRHLWHIDYEMVKNFQFLQDQIEEIKSQDLHKTNQILLEEVHRLRTENETLKASRKYYDL